MISATTTGYGDIVPVTDRARLFDALIVTPIRVFFLLLLAGTAYTFIIKRTWNQWLMKLIQKNLQRPYPAGRLRDQQRQGARGAARRAASPPKRIVVIDNDPEALDRAGECGVAVLLGDAARDETLRAAHVDRAAALLVSTGRDDSNILVTLTARKLSPNGQDQRHHPRIATMRISRARPAPTRSSTRSASPACCSPARSRGRTAPTSSPISRPRRAGSNCASGWSRPTKSAARVDEVGNGQIVRLIRDGKPHPTAGRAAPRIAAGDRVLEIIDTH